MFKVGYSLIKSKFMRKLNRVPMPSIAIYFITFRCNLECSICSARVCQTDSELDTFQIQSLFDQLKSLEVIRITGGEPFVRCDLSEIVRHIHKKIKPFLIHITTNGTLQDRILDLVKENQGTKLFIAVSLDSLQENHEEIRGKGSFQKTYRTLEKLAQLRGQYNLQVEVNQTILDSILGKSMHLQKPSKIPD